MELPPNFNQENGFNAFQYGVRKQAAIDSVDQLDDADAMKYQPKLLLLVCGSAYPRTSRL